MEEYKLKISYGMENKMETPDDQNIGSTISVAVFSSIISVVFYPCVNKLFGSSCCFTYSNCNFRAPDLNWKNFSGGPDI